MEVTGQFHIPAALFQGNNTLYSLDRRLSGPQGRYGCHGEEKSLLSLCWEWNTDTSVVQSLSESLTDSAIPATSNYTVPTNKYRGM
jgi:hypothetical protein